MMKKCFHFYILACEVRSISRYSLNKVSTRQTFRSTVLLRKMGTLYLEKRQERLRVVEKLSCFEITAFFPHLHSGKRREFQNKKVLP